MDLTKEAKSGRKSPLDFLNQQRKLLINVKNFTNLDKNDSVNEEGSNHSNEMNMQQRQPFAKNTASDKYSKLHTSFRNSSY